jgi:hypothetical protein
MIGNFEAGGNLRPGIHEATWEELVARFAKTPHRRSLSEGLKQGLQLLKSVGCTTVYVDGSFVTDKENVFNEQPKDFDVCWDEKGVDVAELKILEPIFFEFSSKRAAQKAKFKGEFFPSKYPADHKSVFLEYFQQDENTGRPKGIVKIDLETLP